MHHPPPRPVPRCYDCKRPLTDEEVADGPIVLLEHLDDPEGDESFVCREHRAEREAAGGD